ncbi:MAG: hypothetical protein AAF560_05650 [Acidobacteriota bacterium]
MKLIRLTLIVLALASLSLAPLWGGVVYEIETTDHSQSTPKTESVEMSAEGRNLKMDIAAGTGSGQSGYAVFKGGDDPTMLMVDDERRTYHVMDRAQAQEIAGGISSAMAQMQEALKNVPEDKRAMVEQMMKQNMPQAQQAPERPKSTVRKTSERETHNGYPSIKYEVHEAGRKVRELWVTDLKNVEGSDEVIETFEEMADFFRELIDSFGPMAGAGGSGFTNVNFFEAFKELDGFPVLVRELNEDGSLESESLLRSARRQTLDPDAFEPPSGYKRQEMPGF